MGYLEIRQEATGAAPRFAVHRRPTRVGRSASCEICLPTPLLQAEHVSLEWEGNNLICTSLVEAPLIVGGQPKTGAVRLAAHDRIDVAKGISLHWIPKDQLSDAQRREAQLLEEPSESDQKAPERRSRLVLRGPSVSRRRAFFAEVLRLLEGGMPFQRSAEAAAWAKIPGLADELIPDIQAGSSLSDALARFRGCFSPYELGMLAAGESGGMLERQLQLLVTSLKGSQALSQRFRDTVYPLFMLVGLAVPAWILWPMRKTHDDMVFVASVLVSLLVAGLVGQLLEWLRQGFQLFGWFRLLEENILVSLPVFGPVLRLRAGGRFMRALGPLLEAGLPGPRATRLGAGCTGSEKYARALDRAARQMEGGDPLLDSLASARLFPAEILAEVGRGEDQGRLPESLAAAEEKLHELASRATMSAFPVGVLTALAFLAGLGAATSWAILTYLPRG